MQLNKAMQNERRTSPHSITLPSPPSPPPPHLLCLDYEGSSCRSDYEHLSVLPLRRLLACLTSHLSTSPPSPHHPYLHHLLKCFFFHPTPTPPRPRTLTCPALTMNALPVDVIIRTLSVSSAATVHRGASPSLYAGSSLPAGQGGDSGRRGGEIAVSEDWMQCTGVCPLTPCRTLPNPRPCSLHTRYFWPIQ